MGRLYIFTTILIMSLLNRTPGGDGYCVPWKAMHHLLQTMQSNLVVIFANHTSAMPIDFLEQLQRDLRRVVILDCDRSRRPIGTYQSFLTEFQGKCRERCSFLVFCNHLISMEIIKVSLNYDLLRPWTLWTFGDPTLIVLLQNGSLIKNAGVPLAIPIAMATDLINISNSITNEDCSEFNAIKAFSRRNNQLTELDTFLENGKENVNFNGTHNIASSVFLAGVRDGISHNLINLYNETLTVGIKELPPFLEKDETTNGYKGVCIKILQVFAKALNFSYTLIPDTDIGTRTINGSEVMWTGLFGQLIRREIDLALGALSVTEERSVSVEFTDHFAEDTSSILSTKPGQRSRILLFVRVFPWKVWLLLIIAILVVGPLINVLEGFKNKDYKTHVHLPVIVINGDWGVWRHWWGLLTSTMQRGDVSPLRNSSRILAAFWLLFTVVLVGIYSGLLLAVMSFPGTEEPIETLAQLVDNGHLQPTAFKPSTTYNYIQNGRIGTSIRVRDKWTGREEYKFPTSADEAIKLMSTGHYALLSERLIFRYLIAKQHDQCDCCPYYEAKVDFLKHYYSFGVPKNSPIIGSLNVIIRRLRQMGIIDQWLSESLPNVAPCQETKADNVLKPMDLEIIQGAFYTLAIGQAIAIIVLIGEKYLSFRKKSVRPGQIKQRTTHGQMASYKLK